MGYIIIEILIWVVMGGVFGMQYGRYIAVKEYRNIAIKKIPLSYLVSYFMSISMLLFCVYLVANMPVESQFKKTTIFSVLTIFAACLPIYPCYKWSVQRARKNL